jgi:hypothetical protein
MRTSLEESRMRRGQLVRSCDIIAIVDLHSFARSCRGASSRSSLVLRRITMSVPVERGERGSVPVKNVVCQRVGKSSVDDNPSPNPKGSINGIQPIVSMSLV